MTDQGYQLISIAIYFAGMLGIGFYAYRKTRSHEDYMLAGRDLKPITAALSAGASDMSGWLMMGLPGALYAVGLVEAWIAIGLTIGAYLNWLFVAPRLRAYTEVANNSITIPSFFENRLKDRSRVLRVASSLIILVFFTFYVSSGMVAGGVFFESSFGVNYLLGMGIVAGVTLIYTLFGGFLGASLTDMVQGILMMLALIVIPIVAVTQMGGVGPVVDEILAVDPNHLSLFEGATVLGVISSLAWGLGYVGQPHIIVRFMALRTPADAKPARRYGMAWMIISLLGAVTCGLVGVAWFSMNDLTLDDPETVVLQLSQILFHPLVAGFVLAAVLAAIMSTVSSQLIVCSSALVEDIYPVLARRKPSQKLLVVLGRVAVLAVALIAALLALDPAGSILSLVSFAWAGFGAAFGPIVLLSLFWRKLTTAGTIAGMVVGAVTVVVWKMFDTGLYEIVPGFILNIVVAMIVSTLTFRHDPEIEREFTETGTIVTQR